MWGTSASRGLALNRASGFCGVAGTAGVVGIAGVAGIAGVEAGLGLGVGGAE